MPLSALNWRYVGQANFASSISNAHDAVYTLGTSATYADGSARVPGTGSAWTWNREVSGVTVAVYGAPPINALSMQYILGGTSGAVAYPFLAPDLTTIANVIVCGMNRASGAYTSWSNAQPFTSGFSNYWRATRVFATVPYDNVAMWESQEGCIVQYSRTSTGETSYAAFGALFDPLSTAPLDAETDGRRYYFGGSGSTSNTSGTFWANYFGSTGDGAFTSHAVTNQTSHFGTFAPGSTTVVTAFHAEAFAPNNALLTPSGNIVRLPFAVVNAAGNFIGQGRQIYVVKDAISRQAWLDGATTVGYIVGSSTTGQADACLLLY
jgi:hypothetical protein